MSETHPHLQALVAVEDCEDLPRHWRGYVETDQHEPIDTFESLKSAGWRPMPPGKMHLQTLHIAFTHYSRHVMFTSRLASAFLGITISGKSSLMGVETSSPGCPPATNGMDEPCPPFVRTEYDSAVLSAIIAANSSAQLPE